ncbi:MAG TPA: NAD(P)-dependent oxidoreductase, partial [Pirellulaceae bacterium]|nr:NAD(P)-dependent oxidoreductase [Pirellulaceae bacterium]
ATATAAPATAATVAANGPRGSQPPTFYGAFKKAVEIIARQYWLHYGIGSVGLRPHVVYGPERNQGISAGPSLAARAAALGESYRIGFRGRLGYDYVEDVAQAFVRGAFATPAGAFTAELPSQSATPEEIVGLLDRIVPGCAARIDVAGPELPSNVPDHPEPLEQLFPGWQATSLEAGLRKTIEFYR